MSATKRGFAAPPFPRAGLFTTRKNISYFMRALEMAPKGGYIGIRGYPVFVREVSCHPDGSATVRFERVSRKLLRRQQGIRGPMLPTDVSHLKMSELH